MNKVDIDSENETMILSCKIQYQGKIATDRYGRQVPVHAHGTVNMERPTSSETILMEKAGGLFDRIVNPDLLVRRITSR